MDFIDVFLIGIGLAMDAFAVSICRGLGMRVLRLSRMLAVALCFGFFQALMPVIGYLIGYNFKEYIVSFDHWIAFILLLFLGGKMIFDILLTHHQAVIPYAVKIFRTEILLPIKRNITSLND